ncbi:MAG: hypothetical protein AAGA23_08140 [Pseudomonadota bacterium]
MSTSVNRWTMLVPLVTLFFAFSSAAQTTLGNSGVVFEGGEFRVNSYFPDNQGFPRLAMSRGGRVLVAWESIGQDGDQAAVAAQLFAADGAPLGPEFIVNTETASVQSQPTVAVSPDGSFVVFWRSRDQDGSDFGVFGQRFDADATPTGGEFQVNEYTERGQTDPFSAFDGAGNLMVAWESDEQPLDDGPQPSVLAGEIYGRIYNAAGQSSPEFRINTTSQSWQNEVKMAGLQDGFVAVWESRDVDSDWRAVVFQRYASDGTPLGGEQQVNQTEPHSQHNAAIGSDTDGVFAIAWENDYSSFPSDSDTRVPDVMARIYTADGTPLTDELRINQNTAGDQQNLDVAADGRGGFVVVWEGPAPGGDDREIWARRILKTGEFVGDEFRLNATTNNFQRYPAISGDHDGRLLVVWHSFVGDRDPLSVAGRFLTVPVMFSDGFEVKN